MVAARFLENVCVCVCARTCVHAFAPMCVFVYVCACVCREGWGLVGRMCIM